MGKLLSLPPTFLLEERDAESIWNLYIKLQVPVAPLVVVPF